MKTFSQRKGLVPVNEIIQTDSMNDELRNSLWNILDLTLWSAKDFLYPQYGEPGINKFSLLLWFNYFKRPTDTRPTHTPTILKEIRNYFFSCSWNEVYDFLEFVTAYPIAGYPVPEKALNHILEKELSGYRVISGHIVDITDEQEVEMLDEAIRDTRFSGVSSHLQRALDLLADRQNPDYRNSIKESISSVEGMARIVTEQPKATLADALKVLEKKNQLHPALRDGFIKLYGYTSDEHGIRHAMMSEPKLTAADAKFFLLSCTSFVNYLKAQL